jgi:hypothetical protein
MYGIFVDVTAYFKYAVLVVQKALSEAASPQL